MLTLLWSFGWIVVFPVQQIASRRIEAQDQYVKEIGNCASLLAEIPDSPLNQNCQSEATQHYDTAMKVYSLKHIWVYPYAMRWIILPVIVVPAAVVYGLGALVTWVVRGFKPKPPKKLVGFL